MATIAPKKNEIVVYQPDGVTRVDVRFDGETVWLLQPQIADLFGCSLENVRLHLKNIFASGELSKEATSKESLEVRLEGSRRVTRKFTYYNAESDIAKFNAQYGGLAVRTSKSFHDRFLIVDDKELYLIGASLKDLGKKCFAFTKLDAGAIAGLKSRVQ